MDDDEEEDNLVTGIMCNGPKTKNSKISFIWGSPLHRMTDVHETDPYDTVDLDDTNSKSASDNQRTKFTPNLLNSEDELKYDSDTENSQNTFALFGYDNLGDLDTSDEETNEIKPDKPNTQLFPRNSQRNHKQSNWLLDKVNAIPTYVHPDATSELEEDHTEHPSHKQDNYEVTKSTHLISTIEDDKTSSELDEQKNNTLEMVSCNGLSHDKHRQGINDNKTSEANDDKCSFEKTSPANATSFKEQSNMEKHELNTINNVENDSSLMQPCNEGLQTKQLDVASNEEESEEELITEFENQAEYDHLQKLSRDKDNNNSENNMENYVLETTTFSEVRTDISKNLTNQTLENKDEIHDQHQINAATRAPSEDEGMEVPTEMQRPGQYSNSFEFSSLKTEHNVEMLSLSHTENKLKQTLNENGNESKSENQMLVFDEKLCSLNDEPFNKTEHDIKSELSLNFSAESKKNASPTERKNNPNCSKSSSQTISDNENYFTSATSEQFGQRKGIYMFHCNIKPSSVNTSHSFQEHAELGKKYKAPVVKKEFDNSVNFMKDLCLIGSINLQKNKSPQDDKQNLNKASEWKMSPSIEKDIELESIMPTNGNTISNHRHSPKDKNSTELLYNNENMESVSVGDEILEITEETKQCDESEKNTCEQSFMIRHFGNKDDLNEGQRRSAFDKLGQSKSSSYGGKESIELKYKTRCEEIELSKTQWHDPKTNKSLSNLYQSEEGSSQCGTWRRRGFQTVAAEHSFEMQANQPWSTGSNQSMNLDGYDPWQPQYNQMSSMIYPHPQRPDTTIFSHNELHSKHNEARRSFHKPEYHNSQEDKMYDHEYSKYPASSDHMKEWHSSSTEQDEDFTHSTQNNQLLKSGNEQLWKPKENVSNNPISNEPLVRGQRGQGRRSWYTTEHSSEGDCQCSRCMIKQHLSGLTEFMEKMGYEVKNVSGDGNCLFAAIVDQLRINGDFSYTADRLRKKAVQFLREKPHVDDETHMEAFLTNETWEEYLLKMEIDGQWGDDIILRGISEMTGRKIVVYSSFMSMTELTPTNLYEEEKLYIGHIRTMMHFVSLRPKSWEYSWPLRAHIRRGTQIINNGNLDLTIAASVGEEASKKIANLKEYMNAGKFEHFQKEKEEIDEILRICRTPRQTGADTYFKDTLETMNALVKQKFEVDTISGIPMVHLSYLLKLLVKPKFFISLHEHFDSIFESHKEFMTRIGSGSLGLDSNMMDFTAAMQHFEILENRTPKDKNLASLTFVMKLPKSFCPILERGGDQAFDLLGASVMIDDSDTLPGYTRLRPTDTTAWTGCIEWLNGQQAFLRSLRNRDKPIFPEKSGGVSYKIFDGLDCDFWPHQARDWTNRNPVSGWPSAEIIKEVDERGCTVIKRAHEFSENPDIEFQFVFNEVEKVLVGSFNDSMMHCFRVFKALVDHHTRILNVKLKTYSLLTTMFYCSEVIPQHAWSSNPGGCIMYKIAWLSQRIAEQNLPNYFIPENNMIEHVEEEDLRNIQYRLQSLRWFPFASVYFLLESHSFITLPVIDQLESSIEDYKRSKDKHKLVEAVFVPICFKLATNSMKAKVLIFYNQALQYLEAGFEETVDVADNESGTTFEDFIQTFLTSFSDTDSVLPFAQVVDKERKTNTCRVLLADKASLPISAILGEEYTGDWGRVYVDITDDKWNSIYDLTGQLAIGGEFEECAEILRCSISVLQKDLKSDEANHDEITDDDTIKQINQSRYKQVYCSLRYLVTFYKHLSKCYDEMDKIELFQEHIYDYEEIVGRIDSRIHYEHVAKLYRQLGNQEKAKELEVKMKSIKTDEDQGGPRLMILIRT